MKLHFMKFNSIQNSKNSIQFEIIWFNGVKNNSLNLVQNNSIKFYSNKKLNGIWNGI